MALRTVALWKGQYIGIESIYTVIDGKQINIPDKLKQLREKSRRNELFCPCGCGSNLILVAGDRMLREQHFRLKDGESSQNCHVITEGRTSIRSKIVLKCWLDQELSAPDLQTRVPLCEVGESKRRYEFTFLSREKSLALSYCHERINRSDEKLHLLDENSAGIHVLYVDDISNLETDGQYPEGMMKVQDRQGFCLLLDIVGIDYAKATLKSVWYTTDLDGIWRSLTFAEGRLADYHLDAGGKLSLRGMSLDDWLEKGKAWLDKKLGAERRRREEEERRREEQKRRLAEERQRQEAERQRQEAERQKQEEERRLFLEQEAERQRALREQEELQRKQLLMEELKQKELRRQQTRMAMEKACSQQEVQARDEDGNRWVRCVSCGRVDIDSAFSSYGGPGQINLGICRECARKGAVQNQEGFPSEGEEDRQEKKRSGLMTCPECGGTLQERKGPFGTFLGCSNYPRCRFHAPVARLRKEMPHAGLRPPGR